MTLSTIARSFEEILSIVERLEIPDSDQERAIEWIRQNSLGVSRTPTGQYEVFLTGEKLRAHKPAVIRALEYDTWVSDNGGTFGANRIVFPADEHFAAATSFIVEELIRRISDSDLQYGFNSTEPLIEGFLRGVGLSEDEVVGLLGELLFVESLLLNRADVSIVGNVLGSWGGYQRLARDFVFRGRGVEVKTTRSRDSIHHISNYSQVDPRRSLETNSPVEELFLLSIGMEKVVSSSNDSFSLVSMVDRILGLLSSCEADGNSSALRDLFLQRLSRYGDREVGYVHGQTPVLSRYSQSWCTTFIRIYNLCDDSVRILGETGIRQAQHVIPESVNYLINFPEILIRDINPKTDLLAFSKECGCLC